MEETIHHIDTVYKKLQLLIKKYEALQKDNLKMQGLLNNGEEIIKTIQQNFEDIQQENLVLRASLQSLEEKDKKILEQKINSYIKSLDKTIALLSQ